MITLGLSWARPPECLRYGHAHQAPCTSLLLGPPAHIPWRDPNLRRPEHG